ncbi:MAG TPA: DUF2318 domain-containing protein [Geobacteraceae bacterium]|nr:DUF2318 domain-containing protein [Geobacteraceae bacterium]
MGALKFIPHLLSWAGIILVLLRGFPDRRPVVAVAGAAGFAAGVAGAYLLFRTFPAEISFWIIRDAVGGSLLLLWAIAVAALYRSTIRDFPLAWGEGLATTSFFAGASALVAGTVAGAIAASRLPGTDGTVPALLLLTLAAGALTLAILAAEKMLPDSFAVSRSGVMAAVVALLLFSSSSILRLDLFAPLTMKVMKFAHDFVHQFFESMLIPDHGFIRPNLWKYIGLLFGSGVGFWGGLIIWFTPAILVLLAIQFERLPSVAHIRQGAQRRRLMAAAIKSRRLRLVVPLLAAVILAAAVYRSRFPNVEYWDPKPVPVSASPAGEIFIPKKGEIDLEDGKLHKFLFKQGGREARFFVLVTPAGQLTVDLDACAICKPDGYGQAEGTVICYYCKTLIPLETVGKPGGCNPVPIPFTEKEDGVHIDALTLINTWGSTVQATTRIKEGGK